MGILLKHPVSALSEKAFHQLDYQVMAMAFDVFNSIGNLWDETDYKCKLLERCQAEGLKVFSEVPITITHKNFCKYYFIDLLIEESVYELKTTEGISPAHESQTLNYLFLTNTQHGKIINFRPDSLQWRFVSTSLNLDQRKLYVLTAEGWRADSLNNLNLPDLLSDLLNNWGSHLDLQLYKEAVLFFMGESSDSAKRRFCPLNSETLTHFSGLSRKKSAYQKNLQKYLSASTYQQIDWINFDHNRIEMHSLRKNYSATKLFCPNAPAHHPN